MTGRADDPTSAGAASRDPAGAPHRESASTKGDGSKFGGVFSAAECLAIDAAVWRTDFSRPGYWAGELETADSFALRAAMMALADGLCRLRRLRICVCTRFDAQVTSRFHLDGAPPASVLILGYEPTLVASRVSLADYSRCAFDLGLGPAEFLAEHNPMFADAAALAGYVIPIPPAAAGRSQILAVNNSCLNYDGTQPQGLLHRAEIPAPDRSLTRAVNSLTLGADDDSAAIASAAEREEFLTSTTLLRR